MTQQAEHDTTQAAGASTTPSPLQDYFRAVAGAPLLGWIAWYSIFDGHVTPAVLSAWFDELGLDPGQLPPPLRADGAFETVTHDAERTYTIPPNNERKVTLMIRPVSRDPEAITTHLVREVRNPASKKPLKYTADVAELTFTRFPAGGDGRLDITSDLTKVPAREHSEVDQILSEIRAGFDLRCRCYTGDKIRAMMHRYFEHMLALKARPTGSISLHTHHEAILQRSANYSAGSAAAAACTCCPSRTRTGHRDMVIEAFRTKVREDLQKLSTDIATTKRGASKRSGHVHGRTAQALYERYRNLKAEAGEHSELLQADLFDAGEALDQAGRQIADMLAGEASRSASPRRTRPAPPPPGTYRRTGPRRIASTNPAPKEDHVTHQDIQLSAPPPGAAADTEDPPPTATPADVAAWAVDAGWGTPFVTITQDRGGERDCIRVVAAEVTATALIVALDNGQVFQLEAVELTRQASQPGRLFTLNPPGQRSARAVLGSAALCSLSAASEQAKPGLGSRSHAWTAARPGPPARWATSTTWTLQ